MFVLFFFVSPPKQQLQVMYVLLGIQFPFAGSVEKCRGTVSIANTSYLCIKVSPAVHEAISLCAVSERKRVGLCLFMVGNLPSFLGNNYNISLLFMIKVHDIIQKLNGL